MDNVLAKVQEAFHMAFDIDPHVITMDTGPDEVEKWDSMGHVSLVNCLEDAFGVNFDVDDLMEMESVREIVRIIKKRVYSCFWFELDLTHLREN